MSRFNSLLLMALVIPGLAFAAGGPPGTRGGRARTFDKATVTTVTGQVTEVHRFAARRGDGIHVDLKTADSTFDVHLGPADYLDHHALSIAKGDTLEVTGSKLVGAGTATLIAQSVKKGEKSVTLRDANGIPVWAARGRR